MLSDKVKIHVENLRKNFGNLEVLKDISLDVHEGEVVCIIGPSGSGKSTFLRCLNHLEEPTSGKIIVNDTDITDKSVKLTEYRAKVGMVFQSFNLFNNMTALNNCVKPQMIVLKRSKEEATEIAVDFLDKVGMGAFINAKPSQLSGGQKQRLCIARALLKKPKILILDDSTSAVDTKTDAAIRKAFAEEIPDTTKIIIAQRVASVEDADQIIVLDEGEIKAIGCHEELMQSSDIYREVYESQKKGEDDNE